MNIVVKWNFKTLFSDIPRLILTVLSIAGTFALISNAGICIESQMLAIGSLNEGLPNLTLQFIQYMLVGMFACTLYVLFAVSLTERGNQYRIMRTAGATTRQLLGGLLTEALVMDALSAAAGIGLGIAVSTLQLGTLGIPVHTEVLYQGGSVLATLMIAFFLPPAMILLASPQMLRSKKGRRRGMKKNKTINPFNSLLSPRFFGAGGKLEYALGKQQRRHRALLVSAIVVNIAVLFTTTAGTSILRDLKPKYRCDMRIEFSGYQQENGEWYYADKAQFREKLDQTLAECKEEGLLDSYEHIEIYSYYECILEEGVLSDEVIAAMNAPRTDITNVYRLHDRQYLNHFTELYFFDDTLFDRLIKENDVSYNGKGGVFVNNVIINGERMPLLRANTSAEILTVKEPYKIYDYLTPVDNSFGYDLPEETTDVLMENKGQSIPVGGLLNNRDHFLKKNYDFIFYGGFIFPERMRQAFDSAAAMSDYNGIDEYYIRAADTGALYQRLLSALDGVGGYTLRRNMLGDGEPFRSPTGRTETETWRIRRTGVKVFDLQTQQRDLQVFLQQIYRIFPSFIVMIFIMISLNIVNIVHMNRISRRREHAILTSIGLGERQRRQMHLYESFRLTLRVIVFGALILFLIVAVFNVPYLQMLTYENLAMPQNLVYSSSETYDGMTFAEWIDYCRVIVQDLWITNKATWWLIPFAVGFIFIGFMLAETLIGKRFEREDLVAVLKDDMHE